MSIKLLEHNNSFKRNLFWALLLTNSTCIFIHPQIFPSLTSAHAHINIFQQLKEKKYFKLYFKLSRLTPFIHTYLICCCNVMSRIRNAYLENLVNTPTHWQSERKKDTMKKNFSYTLSRRLKENGNCLCVAILYYIFYSHRKTKQKQKKNKGKLIEMKICMCVYFFYIKNKWFFSLVYSTIVFLFCVLLEMEK